jgi:hypothetical protein
MNDKIAGNVNLAKIKPCVTGLVHNSCWFKCTPLPFDFFEVVVKDEEPASKILKGYAEAASIGYVL